MSDQRTDAVPVGWGALHLVRADVVLSVVAALAAASARNAAGK